MEFQQLDNSFGLPKCISYIIRRRYFVFSILLVGVEEMVDLVI